MKISQQTSVRVEQKLLKNAIIIGLTAMVIGGGIFFYLNMGTSNKSSAKTSTTPTIVNAYASVDSISGSTIYLSNVDETYDSFNVNSKFILVQMQDNVVRTDTNNNSSFGKIATIANAGNYEVLLIDSVSRSSGNLVSLSIGGITVNNYSTGSNSSLQIVSFPELGNGTSYTTNTDIVSQEWNGSTGGVLAFQVEGVLNLDHNISASGYGFRSGEQ